MPRVNVASLDRLEANEARQRKKLSQSRAIRRAKHRAFHCLDCGGDCQTLLKAIQVSMERLTCEFESPETYSGGCDGGEPCSATAVTIIDSRAYCAKHAGPQAKPVQNVWDVQELREKLARAYEEGAA